MTPYQLLNYCVDVIGPENCDVRSDYEVYPPDYYIEISCGTCYACLKKKRKSWYFRLVQEVLCHKSCSFVTLTFSDEYIEEFKDDYKRPLKLYLDRLRKALGYRPRYWFCSELGDEIKFSGRLHFHGIFFGTSRESLSYHLQRSKWKYGHSFVGSVTEKTINYVTKYISKFDPKHKPIIMCSNGIGLSYLTNAIKEWHINGFDFRPYCVFNGRKYPLSDYYKNKILDDSIRLCLMINRYNDKSPKVWRVGNKEFTNPLLYYKYRSSEYSSTLRIGSSMPIPKRLNRYSNNDIIPLNQYQNFKHYEQIKLCFSKG